MGANTNQEENGFDDEEMTVTLELENGSVTCAIIVILTVETQDYIVLLPLDENGENEDGDVWIYRYHEDESDPNIEPTLEYIEDDAEYQRAADAFSDYLEEHEHDELVEEADE